MTGRADFMYAGLENNGGQNAGGGEEYANSPFPNTGAAFGLSYQRAGAISTVQVPVVQGPQRLIYLYAGSIDESNANLDSARRGNIGNHHNKLNLQHNLEFNLKFNLQYNREHNLEFSLHHNLEFNFQHNREHNFQHNLEFNLNFNFQHNREHIFQHNLEFNLKFNFQHNREHIFQHNLEFNLSLGPNPKHDFERVKHLKHLKHLKYNFDLVIELYHDRYISISYRGVDKRSVIFQLRRAQPSASNIPSIASHVFLGCQGSAAGYPSFTEVGRDAAMTPEMCITLVQGRRYAGVYLDVCYGSESLDATTLVPEVDCNLRCPGNVGRFCGGNVAGTSPPVRRDAGPHVSRRAAPANVLLTIYGVPLGSPGTTVVGPGATVVIPPTTIVEPGTTVVGPGTTIVIPPTTIVGPGSSIVVPGRPTTIVGPDGTLVTTTTVPIPVGDITSFVTTVTYTTVDPARPTALVPVELCTTLYFEDCRCPTPVTPTVPMATYEVQCDRCGRGGESTVTLTVPMDLGSGGSSGANGPTAGGQSPSRLSGGAPGYPSGDAGGSIIQRRADSQVVQGVKHPPPARPVGSLVDNLADNLVDSLVPLLMYPPMVQLVHLRRLAPGGSRALDLVLVLDSPVLDLLALAFLVQITREMEMSPEYRAWCRDLPEYNRLPPDRARWHWLVHKGVDSTSERCVT
ncbi:hypothetical protein CTA2_8123 [Colletotrichum tanaceti]|uniref:WSC domain-containing protein n=1 Tax=Colletotrichum tanaceti TaxID=1306861 RepID=A0A4U6X2M1_9PEZI|nr:hypothetical protein CTA2_8123 [Colletotrichum tanaceti]TKW49600.1 hypothetical protein CTA1_11902 [Colletotrichum tanaceti]